MEDRFIRIAELPKIVGLSRASIYRLEKIGLFPKKRKIAPKAVAWSSKEIIEWMESRKSAA